MCHCPFHPLHAHNTTGTSIEVSCWDSFGRVGRSPLGVIRRGHVYATRPKLGLKPQELGAPGQFEREGNQLGTRRNDAPAV